MTRADLGFKGIPLLIIVIEPIEKEDERSRFGNFCWVVATGSTGDDVSHGGDTKPLATGLTYARETAAMNAFEALEGYRADLVDSAAHLDALESRRDRSKEREAERRRGQRKSARTRQREVNHGA